MPSTKSLNYLMGEQAHQNLSDDEWKGLAALRLGHLSPHLDALPNRKLTDYLQQYSLECSAHTEKHSLLLAHEPHFIQGLFCKVRSRSSKISIFWGYTRKKELYWVAAMHGKMVGSEVKHLARLTVELISLDELYQRANITPQQVCKLVMKVVKSWKVRLEASTGRVEQLYELLLVENQLLHARGHNTEPDDMLIPWNGLLRRDP